MLASGFTAENHSAIVVFIVTVMVIALAIVIVASGSM